MVTNMSARKQVALLKVIPLGLCLGAVVLGVAILVAGAVKLLVPTVNYPLTVAVSAAALLTWLAWLFKQGVRNGGLSA